jgi:hypothetical protein
MRVWMRKSQSRYYYVATILNRKIIPRLQVPIQVIMLHALLTRSQIGVGES